MAELLAHGWYVTALLIWMGLSFGSFLNVVIHRLPLMQQREMEASAREILEMSGSSASAEEPVANIPPADDATSAEAEAFNLATPRSRCPSCGHQITALENIPVVSWLVLRGRCSSCQTPISARYPIIELATAVMVVMVVASYGYTWLALAIAAATCVLIALALIDYDTMFLPDQLTLLLLWMGLTTNLVLDFVPLTEAVIGAMAGYLSLWSLYWAFKLVTGKEGMGYGDFKLLAALGAWLGWQALPAVLLLSAATGLAYALFGVVRRHRERSQPIPFGPFLAIAGWIALVWPDFAKGLLLPG